MRLFTNRNINTMFPRVMCELLANGEREESRNGPVIVYPEPVCMTYERPWERVLFSAKRRANPFFHLFESMWMLAGRDDAAFLDRYVHDFGARYAEKDGTLHGAYGRRWRSHFFIDQLDWAVQSLQRDPASRRTVITMYDPAIDSIPHESPTSPKDIPCNTQMYLRLRRGALELTVCCRSNDAIWGAFGANVVHFSVLQEYLAHRIGCGIGPMHVMSNNFHVYESTLHLFDSKEGVYDPYSLDHVAPHPLFTSTNDEAFVDMLNLWMADPSNTSENLKFPAWPFTNLLIPMSRVHDAIKAKMWDDALRECDYIISEDWRGAAQRWIFMRLAVKR
jgi:thymidylate synthase